MSVFSAVALAFAPYTLPHVPPKTVNVQVPFAVKNAVNLPLKNTAYLTQEYDDNHVIQSHQTLITLPTGAKALLYTQAFAVRRFYPVSQISLLSGDGLSVSFDCYTLEQLANVHLQRYLAPKGYLVVDGVVIANVKKTCDVVTSLTDVMGLDKPTALNFVGELAKTYHTHVELATQYPTNPFADLLKTA